MKCDHPGSARYTAALMVLVCCAAPPARAQGMRPVPNPDTPQTITTPDAPLVPPEPRDCGRGRTFLTFRAPRPTDTRLIAAFYFPWHAGGPVECPAGSTSTGYHWCDCVWLDKPPSGGPRPRTWLGNYGSGNRDVAAAQLQQMEASGVNVVAVEYSGRDYVRDNFFNAVLPELEARNLQFAVLFDTSIVLGTNNIDLNTNPGYATEILTHFQTFASDARYFHHAKYLKIDNKPVVYFYISRAIVGTEAQIRSLFDEIHRYARDAGFAGVYLVADHLYGQGNVDDKVRYMGASAVSGFHPIGSLPKPTGTVEVPGRVHDWIGLLRPAYTEAKTRLRTMQLPADVTPGIFPQYDDRGRSACDGQPDSERYYLDSTNGAAEWQDMIQDAGLSERWLPIRVTVDPDCNKTSVDLSTTSIVWIYSYNEWAEGTGFEQLELKTPKYPYGFGTELLDTLLAAASGSSSSGAPDAPVPIDPKGTVEGQIVTFGWDGVPDGLEYNLQVFNGSGNLVIDATVAETSYKSPSALAAEAHTWRVRARNSFAWGPFSSLVAFQPTAPFTGPPDPAVLIAPSGCISTRRPTFSWNAATNATSYRIKLLDDAFNPEKVILNVQLGGETSYELKYDLSAGHPHHWGIKSQNSTCDGTGQPMCPWSATWYVTPGCSQTVSTINIADASVVEGTGGTSTMLFTVTLSPANSIPISVGYATGPWIGPNPATASADYVPLNGTLTFAPGEGRVSDLVEKC
jgi:hypothetical protein